MASILQQIQVSCADALVGDALAFFADVPVLTERVRDLAAQVDIACGQAGGLCAVVMTPSARVTHPNQPGPYFDEIRITVRVYENVTLNQGTGGVGKSALETAENVVRALHHFRPPNLSECVVADRPAIVRTHEAALPELLCYDCAFLTQGGLAYTVAQLDPPGLSLAGSSVTIAPPASGGLPAPGAAVFYTTDGSAPSPRNGTIYTAPFASSGQIIRASGWLAGYLTSPVSILFT